jgi:hypothetical protein
MGLNNNGVITSSTNDVTIFPKAPLLLKVMSALFASKNTKGKPILCKPVFPARPLVMQVTLLALLPIWMVNIP